MRRANAGVDREPDGTWLIASDHVDRVAAYGARLRRDRPAEVQVLSPQSIQELEHAHAETWLDRELASDSPSLVRDAGFAREVRAALAVRWLWLVEQQLADGEAEGVRLRDNALATLRRRELLRV